MAGEEFVKTRWNKMGQRLVKELEARHFEAFYAETKEEARKIALSYVKEGDLTGFGGSMSTAELGLPDGCRELGAEVITRGMGATPEEKDELARRAILADVYFAGVNAMAENGVFVNVDGTGNRVASIIYGPKKVVLIVGMNKVVRTEQDAWDRARFVAGPTNKQRFDKPGQETPCLVTGECGDCKSAGCICSYIVTTRNCRPARRITVILVGEELGF